MKIVLSRKGFDSSYGGVASPIFPDGMLLSLPIPDVKGAITYGELGWEGHLLGELVTALTRGRFNHQSRTHLDPDLYPHSCPRLPHWRPLFGQDGAAQSHLTNQGVGVGDLFLFFGWFRRVEWKGSEYRFVKRAPDQHLLYGWLQVGASLTGEQVMQEAPAWAMSHPHCAGGYSARNTLYIASNHLTLDGITTSLSGAGTFRYYHDDLCLTAPGALRTMWRLPPWFYPTEDKPPLTYHTDPLRWSRAADYTYLRSAMRGQEFVFDTAHYPEAVQWVVSMVGHR